MTIEHGFSPYTDNGGTTVAIAGDDFCIVAADTRQSSGYSINTRYAPKAFKITDKAVLACSGMYADTTALVRNIELQVKEYHDRHDRDMATQAIAGLLHVMLYGKRFFPYYVFNIIGGLDKNGKGVVFSYDPVGSYEAVKYRAYGSASRLIQPLLDSLVGNKNQLKPDTTPMTIEMAKVFIKDAFIGATERDIYTGDSLEMFIITKNGVTVERSELKKD